MFEDYVVKRIHWDSYRITPETYWDNEKRRCKRCNGHFEVGDSVSVVVTTRARLLVHTRCLEGE